MDVATSTNGVPELQMNPDSEQLLRQALELVLRLNQGVTEILADVGRIKEHHAENLRQLAEVRAATERLERVLVGSP